MRSGESIMFKEGELIMYGGIGVCRITKIGRPDFAEKGDKTLFYFLQPLYKSGTFYVPVEWDSDKISIRKVISKKEANRLLSEIENIKGEAFVTPSIQQLSQHYQSIIDTHSCMELLTLAKSIIVKDREARLHNKKLGQIDKKFMKKTEDLLYGEFAAALRMDKDKAEQIIRERLES